jgi:deoxyribonuclease I
MKRFFIGICRAVLILFLCAIHMVSVKAYTSTDFDLISTDKFWRKLYPGGGWSLYCGYKFSIEKKTPDGLLVGIEHIFPTARMTKHAACKNRMQCRESANKKFIRMEADLHNMYPVSQSVITYRNNSKFGLITGEDWRFNDCDLEWKAGVFEPRQIARGNIARAMLYMHTYYNIPFNKRELVLFKVWNKIDPPSKQESTRNDLIERLQGNRNPYIDKPGLAERQKLTLLK